MRFASLGSGSKGNALLVEAGSTRVLVDAGTVTPHMLAMLAEALGCAPDWIGVADQAEGFAGRELL